MPLALQARSGMPVDQFSFGFCLLTTFFIAGFLALNRLQHAVKGHTHGCVGRWVCKTSGRLQAVMDCDGR